jgi:hypothetical protein
MKMDRKILGALLDMHGADLSLWPQDAVKPALAFMAQDGISKSAFERMLRLDDMLRAHAPATMTDARLAALENKIVSAVARKPVTPSVPAFLRPVMLAAPATGLVLAALIGFFLGMQQPAQADDTTVFYAPDTVIAGIELPSGDF